MVRAGAECGPPGLRGACKRNCIHKALLRDHRWPRDGHASVHDPKRGPEVFMRIGKRNFASRKRKTAGLFAFVLAGVIGVGAYAFTAKAEVKERSVGAGTAAVTGYTVQGNEQYSFNEAG